MYATDARLAKSARLLGEVPGAADLKIEALAVRLRRSAVAASASFLGQLTSPATRTALAEAGFIASGP